MSNMIVLQIVSAQTNKSQKLATHFAHHHHHQSLVPTNVGISHMNSVSPFVIPVYPGPNPWIAATHLFYLDVLSVFLWSLYIFQDAHNWLFSYKALILLSFFGSVFLLSFFGKINHHYHFKQKKN